MGWLLAAGLSPARAEMTAYAVDGLARVRPEDPARVASSITIAAARNEYEPFQIIVHAGRFLSGVNVTATDLRSNSGGVISATNLTFYREHYVDITIPSENSLEGRGWYPDALIPCTSPPAALRMPVTPRFTGAPFRVSAGRNQPVWVDVFVPKGTVAGDYVGIVTVSAANEKPVQISVQLTVWNITLPDTPSLRSNFGKLDINIAKAHGVEMNSGPFQTPEWNYAVSLAAHRISPIITNTDYPRVHDDGSIDYSRTHAELKKWIDTFHVTGFPI
ncbi:MAG TPA: glycoside hydrolase domain-containing protein, partial [Candidatus Krumholzibacteria bacterium]|nr:glycoside hydrolase domain-containing protein [Candidatus Krumholzibacteria bacterium]